MGKEGIIFVLLESLENKERTKEAQLLFKITVHEIFPEIEEDLDPHFEKAY